MVHAFTVELGKVHRFGENRLIHFGSARRRLVYLLRKGCAGASVDVEMRIFTVLDS